MSTKFHRKKVEKPIFELKNNEVLPSTHLVVG